MNARDQIIALEQAIKKLPGAIMGTGENSLGNGDVDHYFANGVYGRVITIPAGMVVTGKIHRFEALNILLRGVCAVSNPETGVEYIRGPHVWVSPPTSKRAVYTLEETVWMTCHPCEKGATEEDVESLEHELTADNYDQLTHEQQELIQ